MNSFCPAVKEIVSPKRFLQHFNIDTKLLSIHFCKVAHSVTKDGESDQMLLLTFVSNDEHIPKSPPIKSRGKDDISMLGREVENRVIFIFQTSAPVINNIVLWYMYDGKNNLEKVDSTLHYILDLFLSQ